MTNRLVGSLLARAAAVFGHTRPWEYCLESPPEGAIRGVRLDVTGWVFRRGVPLTRIEVHVGAGAPIEARRGLDRPDVAAAFPGDDVGQPGFTATLRAPVPGPLHLRVVGVAADGSHIEMRRTIQIVLAEARGRPSAPGAEPWWSALDAIVDRLELQRGVLPAVLDWMSDPLDHPASFRPISSETTLPYANRSIHVVAIDDPARRTEALRLASELVLLKMPGGFEVTSVEGRPESRNVSIIIPVFGRWALTRRCLERLFQSIPTGSPIEIIVVDDASIDETPAELRRWVEAEPRLRVTSHDRNRGFGPACNSGAAAARGELLVFLNNDALPVDGWLDALLATFRARPEAGVVGARLLDESGLVQEAGGAVFADGSAWNLGRGADPRDPLFATVRPVDYCSAAALATPRALFAEIGGFDPRFEPAYYEDTDYCFSVRARGFQVYVQPRAQVVHLEGGTAGIDEDAGVKRYQREHRRAFAEKWAAILAGHPRRPASPTRASQRRIAARAGLRRRRALVVSPSAAEYRPRERLTASGRHDRTPA